MPDEFWTTQEFNTPQKPPGEFAKPVFETPNFREPTSKSLIDWDSVRAEIERPAQFEMQRPSEREGFAPAPLLSQQEIGQPILQQEPFDLAKAAGSFWGDISRWRTPQEVAQEYQPTKVKEINFLGQKIRSDTPIIGGLLEAVAEANSPTTPEHGALFALPAMIPGEIGKRAREVAPIAMSGYQELRDSPLGFIPRFGEALLNVAQKPYEAVGEPVWGLAGAAIQEGFNKAANVFGVGEQKDYFAERMATAQARAGVSDEDFARDPFGSLMETGRAMSRETPQITQFAGGVLADPLNLIPGLGEAEKLTELRLATKPLSEFSAIERALTTINTLGRVHVPKVGADELLDLAELGVKSGSKLNPFELTTKSKAIDFVDRVMNNLMGATAEMPFDDAVRFVDLVRDSARQGKIAGALKDEFPDVAKTLQSWEGQKLVGALAEMNTDTLRKVGEARAAVQAAIDAGEKVVPKGTPEALRAAFDSLTKSDGALNKAIKAGQKIDVDEVLNSAARAQMWADMSKQIGGVAMERFGLKQADNVAVKLRDSLKAFEANIFLGANPPALVQNWLNNKVMTGVHGLPIAGQVQEAAQMWKKWGYDSMPDIVKAATGRKANIVGMGVATERKPWNPIMRLWEKLESGQHDANIMHATFYAYKDAMNQTAKGMPKNLRAALAQINPRLPQIVEGAVASGYTKADVIRALQGRTVVLKLDAYIDDFARAQKVAPEAVRAMIQQMNVESVLNRALMDSPNAAVFRQKVAGILKAVTDNIADLDKKIATSAPKRAAGKDGSPKAFDKLMTDRAKYWDSLRVKVRTRAEAVEAGRAGFNSEQGLKDFGKLVSAEPTEQLTETYATLSKSADTWDQKRAVIIAEELKKRGGLSGEPTPSPIQPVSGGTPSVESTPYGGLAAKSEVLPVIEPKAEMPSVSAEVAPEELIDSETGKRVSLADLQKKVYERPGIVEQRLMTPEERAAYFPETIQKLTDEQLIAREVTATADEAAQIAEEVARRDAIAVGVEPAQVEQVVSARYEARNVKGKTWGVWDTQDEKWMTRGFTEKKAIESAAAQNEARAANWAPAKTFSDEDWFRALSKRIEDVKASGAVPFEQSKKTLETVLKWNQLYHAELGDAERVLDYTQRAINKMSHEQLVAEARKLVKRARAKNMKWVDDVANQMQDSARFVWNKFLDGEYKRFGKQVNEQMFNRVRNADGLIRLLTDDAKHLDLTALRGYTDDAAPIVARAEKEIVQNVQPETGRILAADERTATSATPTPAVTERTAGTSAVETTGAPAKVELASAEPRPISGGVQETGGTLLEHGEATRGAGDESGRVLGATPEHPVGTDVGPVQRPDRTGDAGTYGVGASEGRVPVSASDRSGESGVGKSTGRVEPPPPNTEQQPQIDPAMLASDDVPNAEMLAPVRELGKAHPLQAAELPSTGFSARTPMSEDLVEDALRKARLQLQADAGKQLFDPLELEKARYAMLPDLVEFLASKIGTDREIVGGARLDAATRQLLDQWLNKDVFPAMTDARIYAGRMGRVMERKTLLNYNARTNLDEWLSWAMPFAYWPRATATNIIGEMIQKPALAAQYIRLREAMKEVENEPGTPERFKGKIKIPLPFLPKWMDDGVFIDPLSDLLPIERFINAPARLGFAKVNDSDIAAQIRAMAARGELTAQQAEDAIRKRDATWTKIKDSLNAQRGGTNAMDLAGLFTSVHFPLDWAHKIMNGTPEDISTLLPLSRQIKGGSAILREAFPQLAKWIPAGGFDPEGSLREKIGVPKGDPYELYHIDRALVAMAMDGSVTERQARQALLERKGAIYDVARQRAAVEAGVGTVGSYLGVYSARGLLEGEQQGYKLQAQLNDVVDAEIKRLGFDPTTLTSGEKWDKLRQYKATGEGSAIQKFYDAHPEYAVRGQMYKEQEQRLQDWLTGEFWDQYNGLSSLDKRAFRAQVNDPELAKFLDRTTRDYKGVPILALEKWVAVLGGYVPDAAGVTQKLSVEQMKAIAPYTRQDPAMARAYDEWTKQYGAIKDVQEQYYALPEKSKARAEFLKAHPELKAYWDWNANFEKQNPKLIALLDKLRGEPDVATARVQPAQSETKTFMPTRSSGAGGKNNSRAGGGSFAPRSNTGFAPPRGQPTYNNAAMWQSIEPEMQSILSGYFAQSPASRAMYAAQNPKLQAWLRGKTQDWLDALARSYYAYNVSKGLRWILPRFNPYEKHARGNSWGKSRY